MKAFWHHPVKSTSLHEVITSHKNDRSIDNKLKWLGYKTIPSHGVVSNVFRILVNSQQTFLRYDIKMTYQSNYENPLRSISSRTMAAQKSTPVLSEKGDNRVLCLQRLVERFLSQGKFNLPYIFVQDRIYTMGEIPNSLLSVSNGMLDINMKKCFLNLVQKNVPLLDFPLPELQRFSNSMIKWCIKWHSDRNGNYFLAKESNGKVVQSETGVSVGGIRVFRGIQSQMIYVNNSGPADIELLTVLPPAPSSRILETMSLTDAIQPLRIELQIIQKLSSRQSVCTNFLARDSSGSVQFTIFNKDTENAPRFVIGATYLLTNLRIKAENPAYRKGDFDFYLIWSSRSKIIGDSKSKQSENPVLANVMQPLTPASKSMSSGKPADTGKVELGLRVDTLCTVASEKSLFEETWEEFGAPTYSKKAMSTILSLFYRLPVVDSLTLKQNHILDIIFPSTTSTNSLLEYLKSNYGNNLPLPERYIKYLPNLHHAAQPIAILTDGTMVPIQFLHRGFDMHNNWQNTTVPACSILPSRRLGILQQYVRALSEGLAVWGMNVMVNPMITRDAQVMHVPEKKKLPTITDEPRLSPPRELIVIGLRSSGKESKESKTDKFSMSLGKDVQALKSTLVDTIEAAIEYIKGLERKKVCAAIIFIMEDSKNRSVNNNFFSCASLLGYIPVQCRSCKYKAKYNLWKSQIKRYLYFKANGNPLCNVNLRGEIPSIKSRVILMVGVDVCHTYEGSTGALVGVLYQGPLRIPVMYPFFWSKSGAREPASETAGVTSAFTTVLQEILALLKRFQSTLDEVIVMQDGSVFSEMGNLEKNVPNGMSFTYMNMHKRTHMRFINSTGSGVDVNCPKGNLVRDLTPLHASESASKNTTSFFIQSHDCMMSTARPLQVVCRKIADHWNIEDLQKLCFTLSHVHTLLPSKLPFPVKCAHILADKAHGAWISDPTFTSNRIPITIRHRMWFL